MAKFYITTPIYYVNAPPHLGHAYTSIVADAIARWHRTRGDETFFLTGTDEHGAKIARAAEVVQKSVADFVSEKREEFKKLLTLANISNDDFIFTADQTRHWPGAQKLWEKLDVAGDLYKASYSGLYCVGHEAFVTEKDLVNGVCADHQQKPEVIKEENYFFRLSKYAARVKKAIESDELRILPESRKNEVLAFLAGSIEDISFSRPSRDIAWGIPVPKDSEHTMYVWADALANYISALGYGSADETRFKKFWPADVHIIGKDILRFHAVYWPAMLLATNLPLPKTIFVHGMILSKGQKMSKTIGNVINPVEIISEFGVDTFRYFVAREIPFGEDGDFTRERFADVYEGSLAHGIGNLVSRVSAMIAKNFPDGLAQPSAIALASVPTRRIVRQEVSAKRVDLEGEALENYFESEVRHIFEQAMSNFELTEAISTVMNFFSFLDGYVQEYEPFRLVKTDSEKAAAVLWNLAVYIAKAGALLEPFMPTTAREVANIFKVSKDEGRIVVEQHLPLFPSKKLKTKN